MTGGGGRRTSLIRLERQDFNFSTPAKWQKRKLIGQCRMTRNSPALRLTVSSATFRDCALAQKPINPMSLGHGTSCRGRTERLLNEFLHHAIVLVSGNVIEVRRADAIFRIPNS